MSTHSTIVPRPGILDITPYKGGAAKVEGVARVYKLSSNENPLGPSEAAKEAARKATATMELYPDGGHRQLREAIAGIHGIEADRIVCGAGSDEIIALLCRAYSGPGDEVLYSAHGFLMYMISARVAGATPVTAPETNLTTNIDAMIAAMNERTRLVFIANPNSPTGTMVSLEEIERLADALPPKALLIIDSAYAEFVEGYDGGAELVRNRDNVVMTRTFSKIYGLGAMRLGWCYAPDHVIDILNRVRGPFNVTAPALAAGEAAVRDRDWVAHCRAENAKWRAWVTAELTRLNIPVVPSHGNFLLVEVGEDAAGCDAHLASRGVLVRRMEAYGLPRHLRISIGDEDGCRALISALRDWIDE
ncbi:histidinol-phosphate transaminase [Rhodobacteraceae bacterium NNCM2]|nr:histidinol-phosphate transaminase [Coraliihabitans acroporae]